MDLAVLLTEAIAQDASDVFISANATPLAKIEGMMKPLSSEVLNNEQARLLIYSILTDREKAEFEDTWELNKSLHLVGLAGFASTYFGNGAKWRWWRWWRAT